MAIKFQNGKPLFQNGKPSFCCCGEGECTWNLNAGVSPNDAVHHIYMEIGGNVYYFDNPGDITLGPVYWSLSGIVETFSMPIDQDGTHTIRIWYNQPTNDAAEEAFEAFSVNLTVTSGSGLMCITFDGVDYDFENGVDDPNLTLLIPGLQAAAYVGYNNGDQSANTGGATLVIKCGAC